MPRSVRQRPTYATSSRWSIGWSGPPGAATPTPTIRSTSRSTTALVDLAGNAKLLALYRRLVNELNLYRRAALDAAGTLPVSVSEHRAIVERIAAGQAAAAGRLLHEHVMGSRVRARDLAAREPADRPALRAGDGAARAAGRKSR